MEQRIKEYEKFIKTETSKSLSTKELTNLRAYHAEMLAQFQKERLCHLLVTFFFVFITLASLTLTTILFYNYSASSVDFSWNLSNLPLLTPVIITAILVILSFFYVKHYYFLENHIQELYKYNKKIFTRGQ